MSSDDRRNRSRAAAGSGNRRKGERRDSMRVPVEVGVRLPGRVHYLSLPGDVSLGGVYLDAAVSLAKNTEVELYLPLRPFSYDLAVRGRVTRSPLEKRQGVRIVFVNLDFEAERLLARFIDHAVEEAVAGPESKP
jgi:hypothetical protein